jgi:hypothetical protein
MLWVVSVCRSDRPDRRQVLRMRKWVGFGAGLGGEERPVRRVDLHTCLLHFLNQQKTPSVRSQSSRAAVQCLCTDGLNCTTLWPKGGWRLKAGRKRATQHLLYTRGHKNTVRTVKNYYNKHL